jgi:hypothetical protein
MRRLVILFITDLQLNDYFEFLIGEAREDEVMNGAPEGGSRHPVEARMDWRELARFHVDIGKWINAECLREVVLARVEQGRSSSQRAKRGSICLYYTYSPRRTAQRLYLTSKHTPYINAYHLG